MVQLQKLIDGFWEWAEVPQYLRKRELSRLPIEPSYYPNFNEMRKVCISLTNVNLTKDEIENVLFCMALDDEEECILSYYKEHATDVFLTNLVSIGINFPQRDARWQMAVLLQRPISGRKLFLEHLLVDEDLYVRKRAKNTQDYITDR